MPNGTVVIGVFEDRFEASQAIDELHQAGFAQKDLGFAIRGHDVAAGGMITDTVGTKDSHGAMAGIATGAVAGGLLGAIASIVIPPVGPVLLAGTIASALGFAGAGAAVGGILGAMHGLELSQEEAEYYEKQFNAGKAIVTVHAGDAAAKAREILAKHGGDASPARDLTTNEVQ